MRSWASSSSRQETRLYWMSYSSQIFPAGHKQTYKNSLTVSTRWMRNHTWLTASCLERTRFSPYAWLAYTWPLSETQSRSSSIVAPPSARPSLIWAVTLLTKWIKIALRRSLWTWTSRIVQCYIWSLTTTSHHWWVTVRWQFSWISSGKES